MKLKQTTNQRQRFVIAPEILDSISPEEINATYKDMYDLKLHYPPYRYFDIELDASSVFAQTIMIPKGTQYDDFEELITRAAAKTRIAEKGKYNILITYNFKENLDYYDADVLVDNGDHNFRPFYKTDNPEVSTAIVEPLGKIEVKKESLDNIRVMQYKVLIVLLATKNIIKEVKINKLAKLGIGKNKHKPYSSTYLRIGKITESVSKDSSKSGAPGIHRRPHLRRGHKRDQRYGLGLKYTKSILIPPCFVNADKDWIADRTEYRVL